MKCWMCSSSGGCGGCSVPVTIHNHDCCCCFNTPAYADTVDGGQCTPHLSAKGCWCIIVAINAASRIHCCWSIQDTGLQHMRYARQGSCWYRLLCSHDSSRLRRLHPLKHTERLKATFIGDFSTLIGTIVAHPKNTFLHTALQQQ
jgi:hypothetical protein